MGLTIQWPGAGGVVIPYISHTGLCHPIRSPSGRVFVSFWSENGYTLCRFGLESGMVFNGTTESMNVVIISIPDY